MKRKELYTNSKNREIKCIREACTGWPFIKIWNTPSFGDHMFYENRHQKDDYSKDCLEICCIFVNCTRSWTDRQLLRADQSIMTSVAALQHGGRLLVFRYHLCWLPLLCDRRLSWPRLWLFDGCGGDCRSGWGFAKLFGGLWWPLQGERSYY